MKDKKVIGDYSDYICICEKCGGVEWQEISDKAIIINLNEKGVTEKISEEWKDSDTYRICNDCGSSNLEYIDFGDIEDEEVKAIAKMDNKERLDWLKKRKVMDKIK